MTLRRRIIVGFVAVALVLVASNVALASTFHTYLLLRVDQQLQSAGGFFGARRGPGGPDAGSSQQREAVTEYFQAEGDLTSGVITPIGGTYDPQQRPGPKLTVGAAESHMTSPDAPQHPFTTGAIAGNGRWRVVVIQDPFDAAGIRVLGISLDGVTSTLRHVRTIQFVGTLAVLGALGLVLSWVMRLGVHPVEEMADTAEQITGGDLSRRIEEPDPATEAGRMGTAFNAMLDSIQEAFRAREASEAKVRRFAADASHELRTPLTSIRGYAELYRAGALADEGELRDAMARIESEAERMGSLVEELLQLARLDQEQVMEFSDVDLGDLATDAVNDAHAVEPDRPITITVEGVQPVIVRGNDPALRQVLANLLGNVRAHTPPGTPASVTVSRNGTHAVVVVADAGPGMREDVAAHVFERYYRADVARTRAAGGSGLGLSIVESIARAHGGSASVASAPGEGARFEIKLPLTA
jgi:two-component system OmpR family sensor kinase